jgi:hypothetical protein
MLLPTEARARIEWQSGVDLFPALSALWYGHSDSQASSYLSMSYRMRQLITCVSLTSQGALSELDGVFGVSYLCCSAVITALSATALHSR